MKSLGFRAGAHEINWAVVEHLDNGQPAVVAEATWKAPKTYNEAQSLSWYREKVLSLVDQHKPDSAGIRYPEPYGPKGKIIPANARARIEGVILQSLNSQRVCVATGALAAIGSRLQTKTPKAYLEREQFRGLDLSKRPKERQEAILVAVSALGVTNGN
jgi:hypothetical protein